MEDFYAHEKFFTFPARYRYFFLELDLRGGKSPGGAASLLVNGLPVYKGNKGGSILDTPETARDSNPLTHIDKNTPPFLIMHGNADKTVSQSQSKMLYDALIKNGISADYYILNGAGHYAAYFYQPKTFGIIVDFLNRVLK